MEGHLVASGNFTVASLNDKFPEGITIPEAFLQSSKEHWESPCLLYREDHVFGDIPYKRLQNLVENFTFSLQELGVKRGDRVAILSENRPEWVVSDIATVSLRAVLAPIHTTLTPGQIKEIIYELEPKIIIVSEKRMLSKLIEIKKEIEKNIIILYYNIELKEDLSEFANDKCHFIEALQLMPHENHSDRYKNLIGHVKSSDTASIIFTIGPNGKYRGAELSHKNIISNVKGTLQNVYIRPDDKFFSVLPLTHAFEKMAGYYIPLMQGASVAYLTDISKFSKHVKQHKPTVIIGVPRLYEKSFKKVKDGLNGHKAKAFLLKKAINYGQKNENGKGIAYRLYDRLVYKQVRDTLGGNLRFMISGGAALTPEVGRFFSASGVPILEGYGLTECSPIISVNRPDNNKIGTVGPPIGDTKVKIADDGEILIKGPGIMKGYYGNGQGPQLQLEKGWFKTGDLGEVDEDGFIKIIGRKKEVIVLSTGKNVSPRKIESQITLSRYIKQTAVFGDDEKQVSALVVPDFVRIKRKFHIKDKKEILRSDEIRLFLQKEIDEELREFSKQEQVKKFALLPNEFSKENHCLNDDGSLNRDRIHTVYSSVIESLYINGKRQ